jgi:hypothetical protein
MGTSFFFTIYLAITIKDTFDLHQVKLFCSMQITIRIGQ